VALEAAELAFTIVGRFWVTVKVTKIVPKRLSFLTKEARQSCVVFL
jgi:hypothetical protein